MGIKCSKPACSKETDDQQKGSFIEADKPTTYQQMGQSSDGEKEFVEHPAEPLMENIYGFCIASLIQDSHHAHASGIRLMRILSAFILCFMVFGLQLFLVLGTKWWVTATQVKLARDTYGNYETVMYTDAAGVPHTYLSHHGFPRGQDGWFNQTNFEHLSPSMKPLVCKISLSNYFFLTSVLFLWTLTVLSHLRQIINMSLRIACLNTVSTMMHPDVMRPYGEEDEELLWSATVRLKVSVIVFIQVPRLLLSSILLWLGARWLIATMEFDDLLLNGVALQFILNLAELVYFVMVPYHNKLMTQKLFIPHLGKPLKEEAWLRPALRIHDKEQESFCQMFGMIILGFCALGLTIFYELYLQDVLPDYKWDVQKACESYAKASARPVFQAHTFLSGHISSSDAR